MDKIKAYGICLYKYTNGTIKVLLCKSAKSKDRWGFLKGVATFNEQKHQTAIREFKEECNIDVELNNLEEFFIQENESKNIGIYLVNYNKVGNLERFFTNDILNEENLSLENTDVRFFNIDNLPLIKKKQKYLTQEIVIYLKHNL